MLHFISLLLIRIPPPPFLCLYVCLSLIVCLSLPLCLSLSVSLSVCLLSLVPSVPKTHVASGNRRFPFPSILHYLPVRIQYLFTRTFPAVRLRASLGSPSDSFTLWNPRETCSWQESVCHFYGVTSPLIKTDSSYLYFYRKIHQF